METKRKKVCVFKIISGEQKMTGAVRVGSPPPVFLAFLLDQTVQICAENSADVAAL